MAFIQTTERTLNKSVKKMIKELMPSARRLVKMHVAGCGYVSYVKDSNDNTVGKAYRNREGVIIYIG